MPDLARAHAALSNLAAALSPSGQYAAIRARFVANLSSAAQDFLDGGNQRATVNAAKRAMVEAYGAAAEAALGEQPQGDDLKLLNQEVSDESDFIESLWGDLKLQRADAQAKLSSGAAAPSQFAGNTLAPAARIEQYGSSLDALFNAMKASAAKNTMLTFAGDDGNESCKDCQRLKDQRHRASWWIAKGLMPGVPGNDNYECKGFNCQHVLIDDNGQQFTD